jgi:asparagine synthase (glutamine-hydrolysing)
MRTLVGVHDPGGTERAIVALASAAGTTPEDVIRVGSLALAGAGSPERDGAITCLLNGDLYDAREAAARLGLPPGTPPGLVVACGYARYGAPFLRQLRGSYQLVLWDDAEREAIVTQDHLSAQAVFHYTDGARTTFASDVAPLLRVLPRHPAPDRQTVPRWITDRALPDGLTLYEGVRRLQMGTALRLTRRRQQLQRIWEPCFVQPESVDPSEAGAQIRAAVNRAVSRRLDGGATGILLSGGFDSGTLAGVAAPILRELGHTLPAYSAIFPGEAWDESPGVDALTGELGLPSTRVRVRGGTLATALNFQKRWGLPLPAPGAILDQPLLALASQAGQRVIFDGQGGDELFAASPYLLTDYVLRGQFGAARRLAHRFPNTGGRLEAWQVRALLKHLVVKGALPYSAHGIVARVRVSKYSDLGWLTPASRSRSEALEDPWAWKRHAAGGPRWWRLLAYLLVGSRELAGSQDFLRRRAALFDVEARQPLMVDVDLVELMLRLPPDLAFSPDCDRALAREAMRGIVPESVRMGLSKSNYSGFIHRTLAKDDFAELRRVLAPRDAEIGAFVNLELVRRDLLGHPPQAGDPGWQLWGQHVWALATTELWLRSNALGTDFARWAEDLHLNHCRVDMLAAPRRTCGSVAASARPFFSLASDPLSAYSPTCQPNVCVGGKHGEGQH